MIPLLQALVRPFVPGAWGVAVSVGQSGCPKGFAPTHGLWSCPRAKGLPLGHQTFAKSRMGLRHGPSGPWAFPMGHPTLHWVPPYGNPPISRASRAWFKPSEPIQCLHRWSDASNIMFSHSDHMIPHVVNHGVSSNTLISITGTSNDPVQNMHKAHRHQLRSTWRLASSA